MRHTTDAEFEAQNDMRSLIEAEKIKRSPKRLAAAKAMAKKESDALAKIGKA